MFTDVFQTQISCLSKGNFHLQTRSLKVHLQTSKRPNLQVPQSPQEKLERFFDQRPSPTELKQRNILKDSKLAPSLQSAQVSSPCNIIDFRRIWKGNVLKMSYLQNSQLDLNQMSLLINISYLVSLVVYFVDDSR
jgi:RPEL repeat